jgi:ABC-type uncharacterized transport system permease subunit
MNALTWASLAMLCYIAATGTLFAHIWRSVSLPRRAVLLPAIAAAGFHTLLFVNATYQGHQFNLNLYNALSLVALLVVMFALFGCLWRPMENLGVVLFPVAMITVVLQWSFGTDTQVVVDYAWQLQFHVALSIISFAVLSIASAQAILLAIQDRALRHHQMAGPMEALPALQTMETMLFQLIGLGFALLTLALVSGVVFVDNLMTQHLLHKTVLSFSAWFVFGVLLWGRWQFGWRGRTAINMTVTGMAVLLLAYFGSKLVLELILQRT